MKFTTIKLSTMVAILAMWVAGIVISLAVPVGIIYLVIHFARKYW